MTQRRPGDRRVRLARTPPVVISVNPPRRRRRFISPAAALLLGFAAAILVGTLLLSLPLAAADGTATSPVDAFFTATSAVCVTGLVVVDTAEHWSGFGHAVLVVLMQAGGFGFMTGASLLLLLGVRRRTRLSERIEVAESVGVARLGDVASIVRGTAKYVLVVVAAGMVVLAAWYLLRTPGASPPEAAWWGLFHSISAFNNAGFDLTGNFASLEPYAGETLLLGVLGMLITLGAIGYVIAADIWRKRKWARLALETKLVIVTWIVLLIGGAAMIGALEWGNRATFGDAPPGQRVAEAVFTSVSARSGGFATAPLGQAHDATLSVIGALVFIGGASGATAGGIKVTTFVVLLVAIVAELRGRPSAEAFGRRIPHVVVYRALSVALVAIAFVFTAAVGTNIASRQPFLDATFETVSAFGTNGLSTGITPELSPPVRVLVALTMFIGRLGPLTLVLALAARQRPAAVRGAVEAVRIG
ncbi:MAG TPA: potassium transporter TrkG [Candidatus Limnocylindria bacterium]|nr:potassium transporter TrkG [Candidatus Limnocylindria bacterium]